MVLHAANTNTIEVKKNTAENFFINNAPEVKKLLTHQNRLTKKALNQIDRTMAGTVM